MVRYRLLSVFAFAVTLAASACGLASRGPFAPRMGALRVTEAQDEGDAARRASIRLVLDGLDAEVGGQADRAEISYERAIQVDPTNPFAYLALARHHAEGTDPERALAFLDQASALFEAQGENSHRVRVHLIGLRGEAQYSAGRIAEGDALLEQARNLAPYVWSDGHLSAEELR